MIDEHQCDQTRDELSYSALLDASSVSGSRIRSQSKRRAGPERDVGSVRFNDLVDEAAQLRRYDLLRQDILASGQQLQLAALRPLLDFGHLLWRPLGWLVLESVRALSLGVLSNERILVTRILIFISVLSGAIATLLLHMICRQLGFRRVVSFIGSSPVFVYCNAVVYAASTSLSYMLALAFLMAALWLAIIRGPEEAEPSPRNLWCAGVLLALSVACWFPFILVIPAVAMAAAIRLGDSEPFSMHRILFRRAAYVIGASLAGGIVIFGAAAIVLGINSNAGMKAWINGSAHGWRQTSNLLRLGMGLPRCLRRPDRRRWNPMETISLPRSFYACANARPEFNPTLPG